MDTELRKEYFDKAFKLHSAGNIVEAQNFYKKILAEVPDDSEVLNLVGMGDMPENRLEIFNPITGQSKVLKERQYFINQQPILLNDSRIFFGYPQRIFEP